MNIIILLVVAAVLCSGRIALAAGPDPVDWGTPPFWKSKTMAGESALPLAGSGGVVAMTLAFTPTKILAVKDITGKVLYEAGHDYVWKPGQRTLQVPKGSRIPVATDAQLYPPKGSQKFGTCATRITDLWYVEGMEYQRLQAAVTYVHQLDDWETPATLTDVGTLPKLAKKLAAKQAIKLVLLGDSISAGCNASATCKAPPFMPAYGDLVAAQLAKTFRATAQVKNLSVAGMNAAWGVGQMSAVAKEKPDLLLIAFGMNDASGDVSVGAFIASVRGMIDGLKKSTPDAEVVLVAPMTANPEWTGARPPMYSAYRDALLKLKGEGVIVADVTSVWTFFVSRKKYCDLTGNGLNHPNDFGYRLYAQVISAAITQAAGPQAPANPGK